MAFAELNGSYLKFVEDAARLLYEQLITDKRIKDFRIICSHQESLHSHDAISVILAPNSKFCKDVPHELWSSLIHISCNSSIQTISSNSIDTLVTDLCECDTVALFLYFLAYSANS